MTSLAVWNPAAEFFARVMVLQRKKTRVTEVSARPTNEKRARVLAERSLLGLRSCCTVYAVHQ